MLRAHSGSVSGGQFSAILAGVYCPPSLPVQLYNGSTPGDFASKKLGLLIDRIGIYVLFIASPSSNGIRHA